MTSMLDRAKLEERLSDTPPEGCPYKVGDVVTFTNQFGVIFPGIKILGFDPAEDKDFIHLDTCSWWFGHSESEIKKEPKPLYAFDDSCGHVDAWFTTARRELAETVDTAEMTNMIGGQEVWDQFVGSMQDAGYELKGLYKSLSHLPHLNRDEKPIKPCVYATLERKNEDGSTDERDVIFSVGPAWYDNPYSIDNKPQKEPMPAPGP